jgi:mRNA interferase MazF
MPVKAALNNNVKRPLFKEREVFWASIGENVGFEQDGKSKRFNRPVAIVRKFSGGLFWGVPLSTTPKRGRYYLPLTLNGKTSVALLSQVRVLDSLRLNEKIGMLGADDFKALKTELAKLLLG